jgi:two-component system chemotaxis sensor kinase CheA
MPGLYLCRSAGLKFKGLLSQDAWWKTLVTEKDEEFEDRLSKTFALEANDHIRTFSRGLSDLGNDSDARTRQGILETIFRAIHTLKGAAYVVKRKDIIGICQPLEGVLHELKSEKILLTDDLLNLLHDTALYLEHLLANKEISSVDNPPELAGILNALCNEVK